MNKLLLFVFLIIGINLSVLGQELEPRALTNLPIGTNFIVSGYSHAQGNLLFDSALPLENTKAQLNTFVAAYLRSINFFGLSGKLDLVTAYGIGEWSGVFTNIDTVTTRSGMADLRVRFSFNFFGSPALKKENFKNYTPKNISGFSIQVTAPTGQYNPDKLINLGSNRWTFKPQLGFSKYHGEWIFESYVSALFFSVNSNFWGGQTLQQDPLMAVKLHGIRKLPKNMWMALGLGYAQGGVSFINGNKTDSKISTIRLGVEFSVPLGGRHTLRLVGFSGIRIKKGADFDSLTLLYQYGWNKNKSS